MNLNMPGSCVTWSKATPAVSIVDISGYMRSSYVAKTIDDRPSDQTIGEPSPIGGNCQQCGRYKRIVARRQ